jgi:hypothetical protein
MARKRKQKGKSVSSGQEKKPPRAWRVLTAPFRLIWWVVRKIASLVLFSRNKAQEYSVKRERKEMGASSSYAPISTIEKTEGEWGAFEKKLFSNKSTIGIILGARGSGKTGLGMRLLENAYAKTKRKCYCMGFHEETLPSYLSTINSIDEAAKDSFILIDEGGILFSARKSMSEANKILSEALLIARHNDLSIIFISQNSANLEINALRQTDYLLLKPSSLLQKDFERQKIKDIYDSANEGFERHRGVTGLTYVYSTEFQGFVSNPLPSFWTSKVSKAFRK